MKKKKQPSNTWKIIVGAVLFIGGIGAFSSEAAAGVFGVIIGAALIAWWFIGRKKPQKDAALMQERIVQQNDNGKSKIKPISFPQRVDGAPLAYSYWMDFSACADVDPCSILGDSEKIIDVAAEGDAIVLSYQNTVFGKIVNESRAVMVSDFIRRGDTVCGVLRADGKHVNILFFKDKRKGNEWRAQDIVELISYEGEDAQNEIGILQEGDPLDFEEAETDSDDEAAEVLICCKGTAIGKLPKKYAEKYAESEAYGVFFEKAEEVETDSGDMFSVPYVRIYW